MSEAEDSTATPPPQKLRSIGVRQWSRREVAAVLNGETSDDPVARVTARVAVLQAEIEQRNEELNHLQIYLSVHRKLFGASAKGDETGTTEAASMPLKNGADDRKPASKMPARGMGHADFVPFVRALILERGRPMERKEILESFRSKGRHIGGERGHELRNLGKKMRKAGKHIVYISGSGHWPIEVPCPEVSYTPP